MKTYSQIELLQETLQDQLQKHGADAVTDCATVVLVPTVLPACSVMLKVPGVE